MDILSVIVACSLYPDTAMMNGIGEAASGNKDYVIRAYGESKGYDYTGDLNGVVEGVSRLTNAGKEPMMGRYGLPRLVADTHEKNIFYLLKPCESVHSASIIFSDFIAQCASIMGEENAVIESCAIGEYAALIGVNESNFRAQVLTVRNATQQHLDINNRRNAAVIAAEKEELQRKKARHNEEYESGIGSEYISTSADEVKELKQITVTKRTVFKAIRYRMKR